LRTTHTENQTDQGLIFAFSNISTLEQRRIFKAALFVQSQDEDGNPSIQIIASDHQADGRDGKPMADFFLHDCLECIYDEPASVATSKVYNILSEAAVKLPPHQTPEVLTALVSAMDSSDPTFAVDQFITDQFPKEARAGIRQSLEKQGVDAVEIIKDSTEIKEANFVVYDLDNGIRIIGPKDFLPRNMEGSEDGTGLITLPGHIVKSGLRKRK
jgi:hypothetical protein